MRDALRLERGRRVVRIAGQAVGEAARRPRPVPRIHGSQALLVQGGHRAGVVVHLVGAAQQRIDALGAAAAARHDPLELPEHEPVAGPARRFLRDDDRVAEELGGLLQAGRQVHGVADDRVVAARLRAHVAGDHLAGGDADDRVDALGRLEAGFGEIRAQAGERRDLTERRVAGIHGLAPRVGERRPPAGHHRVADILVGDAAIGGDRLRHRGEETVQEVDQPVRVEALAPAGEIAHVDERDRHALAAAAGLVDLAARQDAVDDAGIDVFAEQPLDLAPLALLGDVGEYHHDAVAFLVPALVVDGEKAGGDEEVELAALDGQGDLGGMGGFGLVDGLEHDLVEVVETLLGEEDLAERLADHLVGRAGQDPARGGVERDNPAREVDCHDPVPHAFQDALGDELVPALVVQTHGIPPFRFVFSHPRLTRSLRR